jgi:hypothetical protein
MNSTLLALAALIASSVASAHGGGLNADGCHTNRKTGDYHCHGGRSTPAVPIKLAPAPAARPATPSVSRLVPASSTTTLAPARASSSGAFANCTAARAAGAAPVRRGDPGYGIHLDRDRDGVGCE